MRAVSSKLEKLCVRIVQWLAFVAHIRIAVSLYYYGPGHVRLNTKIFADQR